MQNCIKNAGLSKDENQRSNHGWRIKQDSKAKKVVRDFFGKI